MNSRPAPTKLACIIDDDEVYVHLIKKIIKLKKLSDELLVFTNGQEAINYFKTFKEVTEDSCFPEIILLDLNMPVMDGWDFLENYNSMCLSKELKTMLYVVSSSIDPYEMEKARSLESVTDYLVKPVSIEDFEAIFNKTA